MNDRQTSITLAMAIVLLATMGRGTLATIKGWASSRVKKAG